MNELYTTGVPLPFQCAYACRVPIENMRALESALHTAFAPHRVNPNREFFALEPGQLIPLMKVINSVAGTDVTDEVEGMIDKGLTAGEKQARAQALRRLPAFNLIEMGLQPGERLVFVEDETIACTVAGPRNVIYEGEEYRLGTLTSKLHGSPVSQATRYWKVEDVRILRELYEACYIYPPSTEEAPFCQ